MCLFYKETDGSSHSKYTILGIFWGMVGGGCRDTETYDFSCVCWINDAVVPESCSWVIGASLFLVCLHHLCLECFFFILWPLQQRVWAHYPHNGSVFLAQNKKYCALQKHQERTLPGFLAFSCCLFLFEKAHQQPEWYNQNWRVYKPTSTIWAYQQIQDSDQELCTGRINQEDAGPCKVRKNLSGKKVTCARGIFIFFC